MSIRYSPVVLKKSPFCSYVAPTFLSRRHCFGR